jgi:hypothetical protein
MSVLSYFVIVGLVCNKFYIVLFGLKAVFTFFSLEHFCNFSDIISAMCEHYALFVDLCFYFVFLL